MNKLPYEAGDNRTVTSMRYNPPAWWLAKLNFQGNYLFHGITKLCNAVAKDKDYKLNMIEIGTWAGESTSILAMSGFFNSIDTIDPWTPWDTEFYNELKTEFETNTRHWDYITHHSDYSYNCVDKFKDGNYDFVYIDGAHDYESVKKDIELYLPKVKDGGYIGGHDYMIPDPEFGVTEAVHDVLGKPNAMFRDTSWLIKVK
jgi:hypothetical protein